MSIGAAACLAEIAHLTTNIGLSFGGRSSRTMASATEIIDRGEKLRLDRARRVFTLLQASVTITSVLIIIAVEGVYYGYR